ALFGVEFELFETLKQAMVRAGSAATGVPRTRHRQKNVIAAQVLRQGFMDIPRRFSAARLCRRRRKRRPEHKFTSCTNMLPGRDARSRPPCPAGRSISAVAGHRCTRALAAILEGACLGSRPLCGRTIAMLYWSVRALRNRHGDKAGISLGVHEAKHLLRLHLESERLFPAAHVAHSPRYYRTHQDEPNGLDACDGSDHVASNNAYHCRHDSGVNHHSIGLGIEP